MKFDKNEREIALVFEGDINFIPEEHRDGIEYGCRKTVKLDPLERIPPYMAYWKYTPCVEA
jgi:hypothetical protein